MDAQMRHCAAKTDLNLLIECLKYQMNSPDSQKQALLTIYTICQKKDKMIKYLQDVGGLHFVYNLYQSSAYCEVKEAALFVVAALAEENVFYQSDLCRGEIFSDLARSLHEDLPVNLKRTVVYMVSALVSNNKSGQILAKSSGCVDILLKLFSTTFPFTEASLGSADIRAQYQLWASVSSALCGCVNNPQHEENQHMCMTVFAVIKQWLLESEELRKEIVQPISSFVAMTVANNSCAQDRFASVGALSALAGCIGRLAPEACRSSIACETAVVMTKALCACVADNPPLAAPLANYQLVSQLLSLLSCPSLLPAHHLCVVLTLGHCTGASEAHQWQFLESGGLSHMINLLAEVQDEELKKAATFVLQTCKQITKTVRSAGSGDHGNFKHELEPPCDMGNYWSSARELFQRIKLLEDQQDKDLQGGVDEGQKDLENSTDMWCGEAQHGFVDPSAELLGDTPIGKVEKWLEAQSMWGKHKEHQAQSTPQCTGPERESANREDVYMDHIKRQISHSCVGTAAQQVGERRETKPKLAHSQSNLSTAWQDGAAEERTERMGVAWSSGGGITRVTQSRVANRKYEKQNYQTQRQLRTFPKDQIDHMSICSDILDSEIRSILQTPVRGNIVSNRCSAGCAPGLPLLNSRNFSQILVTCQYKCDRHMVLLEAEGRFKNTIRELMGEKQRAKKPGRQITLTPIRRQDHSRTAQTDSCKISLDLVSTRITPRSKDGERCRRENSCIETSCNCKTPMRSVSLQRRERKSFSTEEVEYLKDGVKKLGPCWNSILWSYPFQEGRTNVDLAKKYRRLQKDKMQQVDPS